MLVDESSEPAEVGTQNRKMVQKSLKISVMKIMKFIHIILISSSSNCFSTSASRLFWSCRPESR